MTEPPGKHVFLSYNDKNQGFVESLAQQLQTDPRLTFWFAPWHAVPGYPVQEQTEEALVAAQACVVFLDGSGQVDGWQNEEMRVAIETRVSDEPTFRVVPVFVPGAARPTSKTLPRFLRRYLRQGLEIRFRSIDDDAAYGRLVAGILGVPPIEVAAHVTHRIRPERIGVVPAAALDIDPDNPPIGAIRELLMAAFSPEDLRSLCQDRADLRPVVSRFGSGHGLDDMVAEVIDYCDKRLLWDVLLAEVARVNPQQYVRFEPRLGS